MNFTTSIIQRGLNLHILLFQNWKSSYQVAVTDQAMAEHSYVSGTTDLIFSVNEEVGALAKALKVFEAKGVNLTHIESRPSRTNKEQYEFLVTCKNVNGVVSEVVELLKTRMNATVRLLSAPEEKKADKTPWFPRTIRDFDQCANKIIRLGSKLDSDHPGFTDATYIARREEIAEIALNYRHGQVIPKVAYTKDEIETWGTILRNLTTLYPKYACKEFNRIFPILQDECGYREDNIPQLEDVSQFLQRTTGWRLRPVAGLLSSRNFLAGMAFRVFPATQYIRHHSQPLFTPEPDVCHELIGHVPLFADPAFAQFSQEVGLASLGAPNEWIKKLIRCYLYTIEFGLCRQNGQLKAYGAGLLSSFGELQYCLSDKPERKEFEPNEIAVQTICVTEYQKTYYITDGFEDAKGKLLKFCDQIPRRFVAKYNPYTMAVELLDNKEKIVNHAAKLRDELEILTKAVERHCT